MKEWSPAIEVAILQQLVKDLKRTPIVTLAGNGGAYEYIEQRIQALQGEQA